MFPLLDIMHSRYFRRRGLSGILLCRLCTQKIKPLLHKERIENEKGCNAVLDDRYSLLFSCLDWLFSEQCRVVFLSSPFLFSETGVVVVVVIDS